MSSVATTAVAHPWAEIIKEEFSPFYRHCAYVWGGTETKRRKRAALPLLLLHWMAPFQEMGVAAQTKKPRVDPWSRGKGDRFSGPNSMHAQLYAAERAKSPNPTAPKPRVPRQETPARQRPSSVPKTRPSPTPTAKPLAEAATKAAASSPEQPLGAECAGPKGSARAASSAFAPAAKGRFEGGPGSFYAATPGASTPGPGTFNPDDGPNAFGASGKSPGGIRAAKPSPGMAPTAKGRFDAGSIYGTAGKGRPARKKAPAPAETDAEADEWSKKLGLGAIAGAKAAPVLKAVDAARAEAEAKAAQAEAEKAQAEVIAAEAVRKAEWMTTRAQERVAEAEERCARWRVAPPGSAQPRRP